MGAFGPFLSGYCNVHTQLYEHLKDRTFEALDEHARQKAALASAEDVVDRGWHIRQAFLDSLGGLPHSDEPLNAQILGTVQRNGFRIEKVIFESQPQVYVAAHLYVPDALNAPAPGVLFVCGHGREAKAYPEYQMVLHDLAQSGFVALAIDPTGQGERVTHLNPDTGKQTLEWGTTEHSYQGLQCVLTGGSIARYFLFDALRSIDYLQSRPEVDGDHIGVTGNSGGGTQTALLCMTGDERIKAAAPCTYVTSREHYFRTGQAQDAEQLQFAMTKRGINFDDMFIPFAPRPLLIGGVASDFFNPEGTTQTYHRLRGIYRLLDREDYVACMFAPGVHCYAKELRQAVVNWFLVNLTDREPDFETAEDEAIEILPDGELWCTSKGHVLTDFPDGKTPFHLNCERIPQRAAPADTTALRNAVIDVLGIRDRVECPVEPYPRDIETRRGDGKEVHSVFFLSEPGVMVAGALACGKGMKPKEAVILLAPEGTEALDAHLNAAEAMLIEGKGVFLFDVRGTGAVQAHPINARSDTFPGTLFNTEARLAYDAYCLGESLLGMRVFDVLRAAHHLRTLHGIERIGLHAEGLQPALWGYLAAALDESIETVHIDGLIESFEAVARTELYRRDFTPAAMLHGVLQHFDLPDLRVLFEGRALDVREAPVE